MVAVYTVMVFLGATTSSIGIAPLRQDPENPLGTQFGLPRAIRSDEYNAFSPIALSVMATGAAPTLSAMGARADLVHRFTTGGFFESFVFFDSALLKLAGFLPDASVFAAHWWLPLLLLLLMMPKWFDQVGASRRMGWLAAGLIALSPCVAWWSMMPVALIAYTLTGSSLMITAYHRFNRGQRLTGALAGLVGGILIAGMPSFYTPWSLVLGLPVLVASTLWVLTRAGSRWDRFRPVLLTGTTAVVFGIGLLRENSEGLQAMFSTVYPGSRRSAAESQPFGLLFGAPALSPLQGGTPPVQLNASEVSTSFTVAFIWIAVLLAGSKLIPSARRGIAAWTVLAFGLVWLGWCVLSLGSLGSLGQKIPLFNLVPSVRSTQVVGVLGVIAVCLLLSMLDSPGRKTAVLAALTCGTVTGYAASQLQTAYLPDMQFLVIPAAAVGVASVVFLVTLYPNRTWPVVLAVVLAALPVYQANPLVLGLADLRESETAGTLYKEGAIARAEGTLWASDLVAFDTVALANGVPTLSGLQRSGPDKAMWHRLDPRNEFDEAWNRGGGYVPFNWAPGEKTDISNYGADVTVVRIDPCVLAEAMPELGHIASTFELQAECLQAEQTLQWSGASVFTYRVVRD